MKKFLLMLAMVATTTAASSAFTVEKSELKSGNGEVSAAMKSAPQRAHQATDDGFILRFCEENVYSWYSLLQQNKVTYRCYIPVSAEMATEMAGNQITAIRVSVASAFSTNKSGFVFVTEEMPEYGGQFDTATNCEFVNCYALYLDYQEVTLEKPYTVKAGQGFCFGFQLNDARFSTATNKADYPVAIDGYAAGENAGMVELFDSKGNSLGTCDMQTDFGTNLYLSAVTEGDCHGFVNNFKVGTPLIGNFTLPVFTQGEQPVVYVPIRNTGTNALTTIEYSMEVNGEDAGNYAMDINVGPSQTVYLPLDTPELESGRNTISVNVAKVNGVETEASASTECVILDGQGYERNFVVEEFTGTWCGWCPRGIVAMEHMSEAYPDRFIGIAVHGDDDMQPDSYLGLLQKFADGFPSCIVNRDPIYLADPDTDTLEDIYNNYWFDERAIAKVSAVGALDEDGMLNVTMNTTFALSESNGDYSLAVVLIEDGLVDVQKNYYAGGGNGNLPGWSDKGQSVTWTYSDTARDIFDCFGLAGSVPAAFKAGQELTYNYAASTENIEDTDELRAVVLLLDGKTGTILNAANVNLDSSGVDATFAGLKKEAPVEYFNLQGLRIDEPANGIYIRRQGTEVSKVIVK